MVNIKYPSPLKLEKESIWTWAALAICARALISMRFSRWMVAPEIRKELSFIVEIYNQMKDTDETS